MADIKKTVDKIALKDLAYEKQPSGITGGSNLIEPTEAMIRAVVAELRKGKSHAEVKKAVKKSGSKLTLSFGQIKEIHKALDERLAKLTPAVSEVE